MSTVHGGPGNIVTNGLVLNLNAANPRSYPPPYNGNTWTDLSGNNNNGTLINGPTYNSANGGSIVFDGVNDYVPLTTSNLLSLQSISVSLWFSLPGIGASQTLMRNRTFGWGIFTNNSSKNISCFLFPTSNTGQIVILTTTDNYIIPNTPTYVTITFGNSTFSLYVNNKLIETKSTVSNSIYNLTPSISIGRDGDFDGNYFLGRIFNSLVYNRALSASEVLQNFNATRSRFGI